MSEGSKWRQRLEPEAVWRAIDRARQAPESAIAERRRLRAGVRVLRDALDALLYSQVGGQARRLTDAVCELLFELDAIDLVGLGELADNPRRRQALRRKVTQSLARP